MHTVDVIAFDYYGTLEEIHTRDDSPRAWLTLAHFMRYHGADYAPEALREAFDCAMEAEAAQLAAAWTPTHHPLPEGVIDMRPEADVLHALKLLYAEKGVQVDEALLQTTAQVLRAACTDYFRLYSGAERMLLRLKSAGKRLALLSNAQSAYTRPELDAVGIAPLFDRVFISSERGVQKPSAAFYRQLIDWAGVEPQRIMMVGNNPADDIVPARLMGLRTCYLHSRLSPKGAVKPDCDLYLPSPDMQRLANLLLNAKLPPIIRVCF